MYKIKYNSKLNNLDSTPIIKKSKTKDLSNLSMKS